MISANQVERTKLALRELFGLWDSRSTSYGRVLYGAAIVKEGDTWKNLLTYFLPLHQTEGGTSEVSADYTDFKISSGFLRLNEAKNLLETLTETGELCLPPLPSVRMDASLYPGSSKRFCPSSEMWFPVHFASFEYRWSIGTDCIGTLPQRTIYSVDAPVYPGGKEAIEDLLNVHLGGASGQYSQLVALAPDYRGRISEVRLSTRGVEVLVECLPGANEDDLIGKVYFEGPSGNVEQGKLEFNNARATFKAGGFPRSVLVALLSKSRGDLIDEKAFHSGHAYTSAGVVIETTEQNIENLVLAGESDTVEFKREPPKKREDLAIAIASFWNRLGGQILIGVEDDGQIVGCDLQGIADTVTNIIRAFCDPPLEVTVEEVNVRENRVLIIRVPEGKDKPCVVREKGLYVRSGGTSRHATRYEVEEMYKERNSGKRIYEL